MLDAEDRHFLLQVVATAGVGESVKATASAAIAAECELLRRDSQGELDEQDAEDEDEDEE